MRHIACQNEECGNAHAPYFDFEPELLENLHPSTTAAGDG